MNPRSARGSPCPDSAHIQGIARSSRHVQRRFNGGIAVLLWVCVWSMPAISTCETLKDQSVCPGTGSTDSALNVPSFASYRKPVAGDYVVIEYDAGDNVKDKYREKASWTDYGRFFDFKNLNNIGQIIEQNGSFLPVIYAKEKIAVRVCGLHFTDVLTVTTNSGGVPEGGADIRGASPVTPPASLVSTLDMLQSGTTTGGTTSQPGLGLGAPGQLPTLSVSGVAPGGEAEDETPGKYPTYTPAQVTASGRQVALLLYSVARNAMELSRLINRTMGRPYSKNSETLYTEYEKVLQENADEQKKTRQEKDKEGGDAPGSVNGVDYILGRTQEDVNVDDANGTDKKNSAGFDKDMTEIQNVNAQITTLAAALSSQAFASNTITLLNNFSTLVGVGDLAGIVARQDNCVSIEPSLQSAHLSDDTLKALDFDAVTKLTFTQVLNLNEGQLSEIPKTVEVVKGPTVQEEVRALQAALIKLGLKPGGPSGDQPLCSAFEKQKAKDFWRSYDDEVTHLMAPTEEIQPECAHFLKPVGEDAAAAAADDDPNAKKVNFGRYVGCTLQVVKSNLDTLRDKLGDIDKKTTTLYDAMNEWYFRSSVEQTDLLQPLTSNAYIRISIVVQRGYTPFTLANAGGVITATATTNVPATTGTASTSTPAHAVKTILVEVHRMANLNLVGGVMVIHIPTKSFALQTEQATTSTTTSSGGTTTTTYSETCGTTTTMPTASSTPSYSCMVQTQQTDWQVAGMAGLVWFPFGHDYFPRHSGYANLGRNLLPSLLMATSITSLGSAMGGVNWEPVSGLDFYGGVASGHSSVPAPGYTPNTIFPSGATLQTQTREHAGLSFGIGFDLGVFSQIFGTKGTTSGTMP